MTTSKFKRFGLPAALIVGGVTAGSFLAPIGLASAQDADTDTDDTTTTDADDTTTDESESDESETETEENEAGRRHGHHRGAKAEVVTEALGLSTDEIRQGFEDGKTLADMATEQGVDIDDLKSAIVSAATERINAAVEAERIDADEAAEKLAEIEAEIDERLNTVPDLTERQGRGHRRGGEGGHRGNGAGLEALEETLGLTGEEIRAELAAGNTLAEVAEAQGVSVEELADQLVASMEERLDAALESGKIDEDRAEEIREGLDEKVQERLTSEFDGERGNRGHHGAGQADTDVEPSVEDASI